MKLSIFESEERPHPNPPLRAGEGAKRRCSLPLLLPLLAGEAGRGGWEGVRFLIFESEGGRCASRHQRASLERLRSSRVTVLAQRQVVAFNQLPISSTVQILQFFLPAGRKFNPLPITPLQKPAAQRAQSRRHARR